MDKVTEQELGLLVLHLVHACPRLVLVGHEGHVSLKALGAGALEQFLLLGPLGVDCQLSFDRVVW